MGGICNRLERIDSHGDVVMLGTNVGCSGFRALMGERFLDHILEIIVGVEVVALGALVRSRSRRAVDSAASP